MILFLAATGWLTGKGMSQYQDGISDHFHAELLEQGSTDFASSATQFFQLYENLPSEARTGDPVADLAPYLVDREAVTYLFFDNAGAPLGELPVEESVNRLLSPALLQAFFEEVRKGEAREVAVDNYERYLSGDAEMPAIAQLRAYPDQNLILGMGRTQNLAGIRLQSLSEISADLIAGSAQRGAGFFLLLVVFTLFLIWLTLHFALLRPLSRLFAESGTAGADTGLTWAELREYAGRLRAVMDEKESVRVKLERELEQRFQAEEERDGLQTKLDTALHKFEEDIERKYAARLLDAQSELMHREARALHRHLAEPLERAHKAALAAGVDEPLHSALDTCLNTVRGLVDREQDLPHTPRVLALQPWLESLVQRFGDSHEVEVQANIENGASVHIDATTLAAALESVLENALHASGHTSNISVDTARDGDAVEIRIVDRGDGIDGDARPHILVPFFSMKEGRDGLGLSVARSVIRQHGGSLRFQSEVDKGTAAIITLPIAAPVS